MKKQILLFIFTTSIYLATAQNNSGNKAITGGNVDIYSPLKPKDGQPAIFDNQADLNAKIQDKKDKTIALITASIGDSLKVRVYREQLWRFENAIIKGSRK